MPGAEPHDDPTEVEWQFDALDLRPVERWLAALPSRPPSSELPTLTALAKQPRRLVDHYVDTDDWRLARAGFVLRTRRRGRAEEATIKDTRPATPRGLRQRLEVTETLPAGGIAGLAELGPGGPVGRRLAAVVGRRALREILEVRTRRQPFSLRAAGSEIAEVALDDTAIVVGAGQRPVQLRRVEVEVVPEWVDALGPLVDELRRVTGLQPATLSKFEAGLLAGGVEIPAAPDLGPVEVSPGSTMGELAFAVVRRHLSVLLTKEPGTRLGEDIEELHDMRVATRRLRAAFEVFATALPSRAQALRVELKWLADALGAVRDLDVQLERMDEMSAWAATWADAAHAAPLGHLRTLLRTEREAARADLLDALDSPRWERLAGGLVSLARQGPNRRLHTARVPAAIGVPPLVQERHRAVSKAARRARRTGAAADFHRLRIRCKRLRYSLEFTAGLYGGAAQKFVRKLVGLQDNLGLMQDAEVASSRLYALATGKARPGGAGALPADTVFVMGSVAGHYRRESEELRHSMAKHLTVLTGKAWGGLVAVMERARARVEARGDGAPRRPAPPLPAPAPAPTGSPAPPAPAAPAPAPAAPPTAPGKDAGAAADHADQAHGALAVPASPGAGGVRPLAGPAPATPAPVVSTDGDSSTARS